MRIHHANSIESSTHRVASIAVVLVLSCLATVSAIALGGRLSLKLVAFGLAGVALVAFAAWSDRTKEVLLAAWGLSLTYNRQYFVLDPVFGVHGAQGPYLVISDVFLLMLLVLWLHDAVVRKQWPRALGGRIWPWLTPFAVICLISTALAEHPAWGAFEFFRLVRIALILTYFRYHASASLWIAALVGLFAGVGVQSLLGTLEVATGRSGILGVLGMGSLEDAGPSELRQESFYGWRRATATMSHPPNLACYLLMGVPPVFALACTSTRPYLRWIAWGVTVMGLVGLACTLSRWPWAVMAFQLVLISASLAALRLLSLRHFAALLVGAGLLLGVAGLSFADRIADRMTRDLDRSVDFRLKENATGLRVARENPLLGVGPNNYREYLLRYNPEWEWAMRFEEFSIRQLHIRPIVSPHNGFLLIAAETGVLGLIAFLLFFGGILLMGVRAVAGTSGSVRAVCCGLLVGLMGLALQQFVDFSIWADPMLYTLALTAGVLNIAPSVVGSVQGGSA